MSFRYMPELMGCKINKASLGGVTLIAIADEQKDLRGEHEATMNIAWGQGASNGELGLGVDQPKSATKPQRCETLDGLSILDVSCGQNTTFCALNKGRSDAIEG
jgi:alpha-tubulin suppressor-like RCC1 family protein